MSDEAKVIMVGLVCLTIAAGVIAAFTAWNDVAVNKAFIEGGYEQRTLLGEEGVSWVKIKGEPQAEISP